MSSSTFQSRRPDCSNDDCEAKVRSAVGVLSDEPLCSTCIDEAMGGGS